MPSRLFETHYTQRTIHLYHVLEDELCVWRPTKEDLALLNDHGIEVTLISGNALWMGKRNHSYGHFVFSGLGPGMFSIAKILNVPGVVPLFEKQKAPLRLMSWCTYRMSDSCKHLLQTLSARCGRPHRRLVFLVVALHHRVRNSIAVLYSFLHLRFLVLGTCNLA